MGDNYSPRPRRIDNLIRQFENSQINGRIQRNSNGQSTLEISRDTAVPNRQGLMTYINNVPTMTIINNSVRPTYQTEVNTRPVAVVNPTPRSNERVPLNSQLSSNISAAQHLRNEVPVRDTNQIRDNRRPVQTNADLRSYNNTLKAEIVRLSRQNDHMTGKISELDETFDRIERSHMVHTRKVEALTLSEEKLKKSLRKLNRKHEKVKQKSRKQIDELVAYNDMLLRMQLNEQKTVHQRKCEAFKQTIENLKKDLNDSEKKSGFQTEVGSKDGDYYQPLIATLINDIDRLRKAIRKVYGKCDPSLRNEISIIFNSSGGFIRSKPNEAPCTMDIFKDKFKLNMRSKKRERYRNGHEQSDINRHLEHQWDMVIYPNYEYLKFQLTDIFCRAIESTSP